eukprot:Nitzschia sp. Nitz4//scaffold75_size92586//24921//30479//NITZ4_004847-RA/size92586-augustus-gene-0.88-mRNA-1//-1//CDS//3329557681//6080//frame0
MPPSNASPTSVVVDNESDHSNERTTVNTVTMGGMVSVIVNKESPTQRIGLGFIEREQVVSVSDKTEDGLFWDTPVEVGDVVLSINGTKFNQVDSLKEYISLIANAEGKLTVIVKKKSLPRSARKRANKRYFERAKHRNEDGSLNYELNPRLDKLRLAQDANDEKPQYIIRARKLYPKQGVGLRFKDIGTMTFVSAIASDSIFKDSELELGDRVVGVGKMNCQDYAKGEQVLALLGKSTNAVSIVVEKGYPEFNKKRDADSAHNTPWVDTSEHDDTKRFPSSPGRLNTSEDAAKPAQADIVTDGDALARILARGGLSSTKPKRTSSLKKKEFESTSLHGRPTAKPAAKRPSKSSQTSRSAHSKLLMSPGNDASDSSLGEFGEEFGKSPGLAIGEKSPNARSLSKLNQSAAFVGITFDFDNFEGDYMKVTVQKNSEAMPGISVQKTEGKFLLTEVPQHERRISPGMRVLAINGIASIHTVTKAEELINQEKGEVKLVIDLSPESQSDHKSCQWCKRAFGGTSPSKNGYGNRRSRVDAQSISGSVESSVAASEKTARVANTAPRAVDLPKPAQPKPLFTYEEDEWESDSDDDDDISRNQNRNPEVKEMEKRTLVINASKKGKGKEFGISLFDHGGKIYVSRVDKHGIFYGQKVLVGDEVIVVNNKKVGIDVKSAAAALHLIEESEKSHLKVVRSDANSKASDLIMSSEDFTRAVTVKRNAKKKSGYVIEESDGEYIIGAVPDKARVNVGDKIMGINGIKAEDFEDEEDANELIDSIRIVVVPKDEIEDYESALAAENGNPSAAKGGSNNGDVIHTCPDCGYENHNLEKDDEGDLVCEQCGTVIPDDGGNADEEYTCPDCNHITVNPQPDDDGDRVCEKCYCILPEKLRCVCEMCGHENVDPSPNDDGEYVCSECGEPIDVEEAEKSRAEKLQEMADKYNEDEDEDGGGGGQQFGPDGKPTTNKDGKKLTPADMFSPGDVITVTVGKSNPKQEAGLKVEQASNGKYYVRKIPSSGLFAKTPVMAGDKILELNGTDSKDFADINELKKVIREADRITIVVLRRDPDASESSADSDIDFDNLAPITPDGVMREEIEEKDDDTAGYDGHDCGCGSIFNPVEGVDFLTTVMSMFHFACYRTILLTFDIETPRNIPRENLETTMQPFRAMAPGRLCLFGEHQDYLELPVISLAISLTTTIEVTPDPVSKSRVLEIQVPQLHQILRYDLDHLPPKQQASLDSPDFALAAIHEALEDGWDIPCGATCISTTDIIMQAGCSSSTAFVTAWILVLATLAGKDLSNDPLLLAKLAHKAEVLHFGAPGGTMDHVSIAFGGSCLRIGPGLWKIQKLPAMGPEDGCWILADSGESKDTFGHLKRCKTDRLALLERLNGSWDTDHTSIALTQDENGLLAATLTNRECEERAFQLWTEDDNRRSVERGAHLGSLMLRHHEALRDGLQLSTPKLEALREASLQAGAWGFKLVGSGGGGYAVAWVPNEQVDAVSKSLIEAGAKSTCTIRTPGAGARIEW